MLKMKKIDRAPAGLGAKGREFWKKVNTEYILEAHHLALLEEAARTLDDLQVARKVIEEAGSRYFLDRYGQWKELPACADARALRAIFLRLVRELGLDADTSESRPVRYGG
jgi:hypothetical protein